MIHRICRGIAILLLLFELANWVGLLHFHLVFSWAGLVITVISAWGTLEIIRYRVHKRTGRYLPAYASVALITSLCIDAMGDTFHGYSAYTWYDEVAHFCGGMTGAFVFGALWQTLTDRELTWFDRYTVFSSVAFMGFLYEIEEYVSDLVIGGSASGGNIDTADDMLWNTIGSLVGILLIYFFTRYLRLRKEQSGARLPLSTTSSSA